MKLPTEAERGGMGRMEFVKPKVFWRTAEELLRIYLTQMTTSAKEKLLSIVSLQEILTA